MSPSKADIALCRVVMRLSRFTAHRGPPPTDPPCYPFAVVAAAKEIIISGADVKKFLSAVAWMGESHPSFGDYVALVAPNALSGANVEAGSALVGYRVVDGNNNGSSASFRRTADGAAAEVAAIGLSPSYSAVPASLLPVRETEVANITGLKLVSLSGTRFGLAYGAVDGGVVESGNAELEGRLIVGLGRVPQQPLRPRRESSSG